jgi:hypothetical protein
LLWPLCSRCGLPREALALAQRRLQTEADPAFSRLLDAVAQLHVGTQATQPDPPQPTAIDSETCVAAGTTGSSAACADGAVASDADAAVAPVAAGSAASHSPPELQAISAPGKAPAAADSAAPLPVATLAPYLLLAGRPLAAAQALSSSGQASALAAAAQLCARASKAGAQPGAPLPGMPLPCAAEAPEVRSVRIAYCVLRIAYCVLRIAYCALCASEVRSVRNPRPLPLPRG